MTLRVRLALLVAALLAAVVTAVTWYISASAQRAFETVDAQRSAALVAQVRREFDRQGDDTVRRLERVAASDAVQRLAIDLASPAADALAHVDEAGRLAAAYNLDFLDIVAADGTIVSSAHWPARFGYRHGWVGDAPAPKETGAFLQAEQAPDGPALGLLAVRESLAGGPAIRLVGGRRLDAGFVAGIDAPPGMRVLLYRNLASTFNATDLLGGSAPGALGPEQARLLEPLVARALTGGREIVETVAADNGAESIVAIPLKGRDGSVLAVLLVGNSHRELAVLLASIVRTGLLVGIAGLGLGLLLAYLVARRVTRPIERLAEGARAVAGGDWGVQVEQGGAREIAALGAAFNSMTARLTEQRDRLVQAERVAAWRELARRLAHELKNPLFPLRITLENLHRAKALPAAEFEEVFAESTATLSASLTSLGTIVGRFGDFTRMPKPVFEDVDVNDIVRRTLSLVDAQLSAPGRPPVDVSADLEERAGTVRADPEQLGRALHNLLLNAVDAMPSGGRLAVRTHRGDGWLTLEVADSGQGLTEEERTRLFTPYYTTKQHGTGLGLAIVQSIVSDHAGRISVESEPGRGATFTVRLPLDCRSDGSTGL